MSDHSAIEWTDATWNPVTGCTKVSPGCDHCYAETFAERWRGVAGHHYQAGFDLTLRPERLGLPLRWHRPRRIFVDSMADLFHTGVPAEYLAKVFAVMAAAHWHTFQIPTKRHARMRALLNTPDFRNLVDAETATLTRASGLAACRPAVRAWPLPNVWLGVSAESQTWAEIRIPALLGTPAAVRFISAEPLLGPIDLGRFHRLDWVIAGGESGPRARPAHPDWFRSLREQCAAAGVAFFFKQWGTWAPANETTPQHPDGTGPLRCVTPNGTVHLGNGPLTGAAWVRRAGKKAAGRMLDGRTHDAFPTAPATPGGTP